MRVHWVGRTALGLIVALAGCASSSDDGAAANDALTAETAPPPFTYDELVTLSGLEGHRDGARYRVAGAPPGLEQKVNDVFDTPRISNAAFAGGARRYMPSVGRLGPSVRVVEWNIERGQQLDNILKVLRAADSPQARAVLLGNGLATGVDSGQVTQELDALSQSDVVILNEVDNGMKRSGYADVVAEIAGALKMNFASTVEFLEVDPVALGMEKFQPSDFKAYDVGSKQQLADDSPDQVSDDEASSLASDVNRLTAVDHTRTKGLHSVAILSRYRIKPESVKAHPLQTICHDWYAGEKRGVDFFEKINELPEKAFGFLAEKIFLEKIEREMRHGGRTALTVDLEVPGLDGAAPDTLTVVTAHVEDKSTAKCRADQIKETLAQVKDRQNPVVLAGDFNTFGGDGRPTTVENLLFSRITDPQWIATQIVKHFVPYSGWAFMVRDGINWVRLLHDPTGINIPFFLPNPERGFFDNVERFTFPDGARFDFRGDKTRTVNGTEKTLANSNMRASKGFQPTSALERSFGPIGTFKIDWMFVRGYAKDPRKGSGSYRMAPHFPRTLNALQNATSPRLSDHAPIVVNLPIKDPCNVQSSAACAAADIPDQNADFSAADPSTWTDLNTEPDGATQDSTPQE
jgi:endonuclease/exonuclease/phosphatase family metal-dependent hydrolase